MFQIKRNTCLKKTRVSNKKAHTRNSSLAHAVDPPEAPPLQFLPPNNHWFDVQLLPNLLDLLQTNKSQTVVALQIHKKLRNKILAKSSGYT